MANFVHEMLSFKHVRKPRFFSAQNDRVDAQHLERKHSLEKDHLTERKQTSSRNRCCFLGGGFKYFVIFTPKIGEMIQFDDHIFQMG